MDHEAQVPILKVPGMGDAILRDVRPYDPVTLSVQKQRMPASATREIENGVGICKLEETQEIRHEVLGLFFISVIIEKMVIRRIEPVLEPLGFMLHRTKIKQKYKNMGTGSGFALFLPHGPKF